MIKRLVLAAAAIGGAILAMVLVPDVASAADKRVALVVGNSTYQTVPQLPNPARDASAVAQMFKDAGFDDVQVELNAGNLEFKRSIRRFQDLADQADIAVIYYAGHGLEIGGTNYLIPVDAKLASDRDADDEAIPLERLVASADGASHLRLIILDACRDNPFIKTMHRERKIATRTAIMSGLGKVEPTSTDTLIAYASRAGSTAEDGEGQHSPFTASLLKNLTVPGLDVRLAFGRIKDEVMKSTAGRQEPFVYGSLGGSNISLVPALPVPQEASPNDIRVDYELVDKVGTARAWQAFLGSHPTGLYADLARAQLEKMGPPPTQAPQPNMVIAALPPAPSPSNRDNPSKQSIEWDRLKDSTDQAALLKFINKFPDSQQAIYAKQRMDILTQAAKEREDKARADREAATKAAEDARVAAEQKKAELAAAKKREDDDRRAKAAEAEQQAKAAAAEQAAAKQREDDDRRAKAAEAEQKAKAAAAELAMAKKRDEDERRAKAAEAEQQAKAVEAERKAAEAKQKAEEAQKNKAAAEAAELRAASEKQAREAEEARRKAELASAQEATCKKEQGELDELTAKGSDGSGVADLTSFSKTVTCDRVRPMVLATLDKFNAEVARRAAGVAALRAASEKQAREAEDARRKTELAAAQDATCKKEQGKLDELTAKGSDGTGVADLTSFSKTVTCDRVRPVVVATLGKFTIEAAKRDAALPNSFELVRAAQGQLARLGCFSGRMDGNLITTKTAVGHYFSVKGQPTANTNVTEGLVADLAKQTDRVCPVECQPSEVAKGDSCLPVEKPVATAPASKPAATASRRNDDGDKPAARKPQPKREVETQRSRPAEAPQARQQASARPAGNGGNGGGNGGGGGGGGGGGHTSVVGVGF